MIQLTDDQAIQIVNLILTLDAVEPVGPHAIHDAMLLLRADEALTVGTEE